MTEAEWLACATPGPLLRHVRDSPPGLRARGARRRFRLFASGCARRACGGERGDRLAAVAARVEEFADRPRAQARVLASVYWDEVERAVWPRGDPLPAVMVQLCRREAWAAAQAWQLTAGPHLDAARGNASRDERLALAGLARCVFGNPFRPATLDPLWLTSTAVGLAASIYESRAFRHLPVLADALEDAGCEDDAVLAHCRRVGTHVRGCWVVDLLLGKS